MIRRCLTLVCLGLLALPAMAAAVTNGELAHPTQAGPDPAPQLDSGAGSIVRVFVGLFLVVVIIGVLYAAMRRAQRGKLPGSRSGGTIEVLETTQLAPGRNIHLVRVGERVLVVGATEHSISSLHAFGHEEAVAEGVIAPDLDLEHEPLPRALGNRRSLVDSLRERTSRA